MRIKQILESVSAGSMGTNSVATAPSKNGKMIRRQKPTDNALDSGKLFQETNAEDLGENQDYAAWSRALHPHGDGASAFDLLRGDATTIRNILAYVKQNRAVLGKEISSSGRTIKDAIIDIRNEFPKLYQAAQQPQGVADEQVDELSKDTLKQYIPRRIEKTKGLAKTDYDKAHRIIKKDIPRAMSKYKDPNYGKAHPTSPVEENKKGVRAVKHTTKPRNFVAKNASATTSGAGAHKDKKKAMKQGETKHKGKEPAYESRLWAALERRIIK